MNETADEFRLQMQSRDDDTFVRVHARRARQHPANSVFESLDAASDFFARGAVGYSATTNPNCCDGLELTTASWRVAPLDVIAVNSSFFNNDKIFPPGTIEFDCALLMRNIAHEWRTLPAMKGHV
ncbi:MAG TPA: hypothetical protein VFZ59_19100 [Verrucomicrobiae bacterium]|nr:hypothetical protein [Verrucomicrobiae bacterium]